MISELKAKLLNLSDEITNSISESKNINDIEEIRAVSYTHLTLPTILRV